ncbi:MAG: hypothetical protein JEZ03_17850, partial [Bacteroidales bacterium]|nr:hypothetical protein [Bacteroidales bacterium]
TYNNPTMAAVMEAIHYGPAEKYKLDKLSVLSMGTGTSIEFIDPNKTLDPDGIDALFWLNLVMRESSQDASDMQTYMIRSGIIPNLDFRRFQLSLDVKTMHKLPNRDISDLHDIDANWLWDLTNEDLKGIELDDVKKFGLMDVIGEAMVDYIMESGGAFQRDLVDAKNRDALVSRFGDIVRIKKQMSDPEWLDKFHS